MIENREFCFFMCCGKANMKNITQNIQAIHWGKSFHYPAHHILSNFGVTAR